MRTKEGKKRRHALARGSSDDAPKSVTLSAGVARRVRTLARAKRASTSRVIAELMESGLQAQDAERDRFLKLADRLTSSKDPAEQEQIKEELARLTFGN